MLRKILTNHQEKYYFVPWLSESAALLLEPRRRSVVVFTPYLYTLLLYYLKLLATSMSLTPNVDESGSIAEQSSSSDSSRLPRCVAKSRSAKTTREQQPLVTPPIIERRPNTSEGKTDIFTI